MAEPFNELDVQHEWEEITVQARYTPCNGTATARVGTRPIHCLHGAIVQPQHGTSTKRVKRTLPVLLLLGANTKRGAMVQPQHGTSTTSKTYITRADCCTVRVQNAV